MTLEEYFTKLIEERRYNDKAPGMYGWSYLFRGPLPTNGLSTEDQRLFSSLAGAIVSTNDEGEMEVELYHTRGSLLNNWKNDCHNQGDRT